MTYTVEFTVKHPGQPDLLVSTYAPGIIRLGMLSVALAQIEEAIQLIRPHVEPEPPTEPEHTNEWEDRWPPGWWVEGSRAYAPGRGGSHDYHGFLWGATLVWWYAHGGWKLTAEVTVAEAKAHAWAEYRETT